MVQALRKVYDAGDLADELTGGGWRAARGPGADGSHIFLGRQGEGLVVAPDGHLYRGALGRGLSITANGLQPDYDALTALD